jgi:hypothetical protein
MGIMSSYLRREVLDQLSVCCECIKNHPEGYAHKVDCKTPDQFCLMENFYNLFSSNLSLSKRRAYFGGPLLEDFDGQENTP